VTRFAGRRRAPPIFGLWQMFEENPGIQGNVKVGFTLLNWIHNSGLSKNPPFPPFLKKGE
jgi:hypothetical protein